MELVSSLGHRICHNITNSCAHLNRDDFQASTSNKHLNFLQHGFTILKPYHGQVAIVVADSDSHLKIGDFHRSACRPTVHLARCPATIVEELQAALAQFAAKSLAI